MKLCSILINGNPCVGAKTARGIVTLTELGFPASMNEFIAGGRAMLVRAEEALRTEQIPALRERDVKFLPVTAPQKIICEGLNFKKHAEETGGTAPNHPVFFSKFNDALSADGEAVTLPSWLKKYDYEAELVIVIGKSAVNILPEQAKDCIFGYTCGNDLSARDAQFLSTQWLSGKSLPGFAPTGPYIVTGDSFDPYESNGIYCEVNGVRVQAGDTSDMIFPCYETVSAASRFFPLSPGDLIFTGTPAGVIQGKPRDERVWLKPGDTVKVTIDGIGTLTTPLV
jgi:2-keto-4-pentenoate hydratase/2-oxohepta-3-ene-1,7-dioic acid hydratase in catechol pathway